MNGPNPEPVITHRVRRFMAREGLRVRPWEGLGETYRALHRLLVEKRNDDGFWDRLCRLLRDVDDAAAELCQSGRLSERWAKLIGVWDADRQVAALRAAIEEETRAPRSTRRDFFGRLCAAALCGFLSLGLAAACDHVDTSADADAGADADADSDSDADADSDADSDSDADTGSEVDTDGWPAECSLEDGSALRTALEESSLSDEDRSYLCDCFEELNGSWSTGLAELFESGTAEEIQQALTQMLYCCSDGSTESDPFDAEALLSGELCEGVVVYMAVCFPRP